MGKLLIIDGNAILHRAYHALPDWRNSSGEATAGIYGFFSMLINIKQYLKPDYLVVVFDMPAPNFRHAMYVGYQSNRGHDAQISEDIWSQKDRLKGILEKLKVVVFDAEGFEADDLIGTVCEKVTSENLVEEAVILTGDRDLLQLVNDRVKVYMPVNGVSEGILLDKNGVKTKMGVWPEQIVDYKALVGDGSDGYPGVAGIGPKTAVDLLERFGDLKTIYLECAKQGGSIKENVRLKLLGGYEMGLMSQKLATIIKDAPVQLEFDKTGMPSQEDLGRIFEQEGYKSLRARVLGLESAVNKSREVPEYRSGKSKKVSDDENQTKLF